eukprot:TRINITY_DN13283_c0_g1_i1.p1 TRINITY_DN13283_c0_g1~~TRINITY_DN13283_c0_g1_i1.p1  ORF type:complete len:284 (+),score=50.26 TRINITY_DN13283_c0_g1_i1:23-874(+)
MQLLVWFVFFFFKQKTAYEMQRGLVGSEMCIRDSTMTEDGKIEERKRGFKFNLAEKISVGMEDYASKLRKQKREDEINRKRLVQPSEKFPANIKNDMDIVQSFIYREREFVEEHTGLERRLEIIRNNLKTNSCEQHVFEAMFILRKMLIEPEPNRLPSNMLLRNDLLPYVAQYLDYSVSPRIQREAAWVISSFTSSESESDIFELMKIGIIPSIIGLVGSSNNSLIEHGLITLSNIASTGPKYHEAVLAESVFFPFNQIFKMRTHSTSSKARSMVFSCKFALQ